MTHIGDDYSGGNDCPPSAKSHRRFRVDVHQGDRGLPDNLANTEKVFIPEGSITSYIN